MTKMDNKNKTLRGGKSSKIYENFFEDEKVETLPIEVRYLLVGLIARADLWGVYPAVPSTIRRNIFFADSKFTNEMIEEWLKLLEDLHIIKMWNSDELHRYLILVKWQQYQYYQYIPIPSYALPPNWEWIDRWAAKFDELYGTSPKRLKKLEKAVEEVQAEEAQEKAAIKESKHLLNNILEAFYAHFETPKPSNREWVAMLPGTKALLEFYKGDVELTTNNLIKAGEYYKDLAKNDNWWKDKWFLPKFYLQKIPGLLVSDKSSSTGGGTPANKVPDIV